jgi:signal transduction histidine kinase/TolA-binding protein
MSRIYLFLIIIVFGCTEKSTLQKGTLINRLESAPVGEQSSVIDSVADVIQKIANPEEFNELMQFIEKLNEKTESPELQISQIYLEAEIQRLQGNNDKALETLYESIPYFAQSSREQTKTKILNLIGYLHQQRGARNITFEKYLKDVRDTENKAKVTQLALLTYYLGNHFAERGNLNKAIDYSTKQFTIYSILQDTSGMIRSREQYGDFLCLTKKFPDAVRSYTEAYDLVKPWDESQVSLRLLMKIGKSHYYTGDRKSASKFFNLALVIAQRQELSLALPENLYWIGIIEFESGNYLDALMHFTQCMDLFQDKTSSKIALETKLKIAQIESITGNTTKAIKLYKELIVLDNSHFSVAAIAALELSKIMSKSGNHDEANRYLLKHVEFTDSALRIENRRMLAEVEAQNDLAQKEQRIELLYKDSEIKTILYNKKSENNRLLILGIILLGFFLVTTTWLFISGIKKNKLLSLQNLEIQEKNEELNQMNSELHFINQQLIESESKLTKEIAAQDKLMSIVAHDLKSPLVALKNILSIYQMSKDKITPEKLSSAVDRVGNELENVLELLNNLLNWAINHRGNMDVKSETIDISTLVDTTVSLFIEQAKIKRIKLVKALHPGLVCQCDNNMTQFVVRNFLSNALKFTPENGEIIITAKKVNGFIAIRVKDSGLGLNSEELKNLNRFSDITPTRGTKGEKGSGIGLILCNEFAIKMKARIEIESAKNLGSTFSLILQC